MKLTECIPCFENNINNVWVNGTNTGYCLPSYDGYGSVIRYAKDCPVEGYPFTMILMGLMPVIWYGFCILYIVAFLRGIRRPHNLSCQSRKVMRDTLFQSVPNGYQSIHENSSMLVHLPGQVFTEFDDQIIIMETLRFRKKRSIAVAIVMSIACISVMPFLIYEGKFNLISPRIGTHQEIFQILQIMLISMMPTVMIAMLIGGTHEKLNLFDEHGLHQYERICCCHRWIVYPTIQLNEITTAEYGDGLTIKLVNDRKINIRLEPGIPPEVNVPGKINSFIEQKKQSVEMT